MEVLKLTLEAIIGVYILANPTGLKSVRYINHRQGKRDVVQADVPEIISRMSGTGVSRIGTELHRRILDDLVLKREMTRPLLVIVITDGQVRLPISV